MRVSTKTMKYFSMFSGIGGFELGIYRSFKAKEERIRQEDTLSIRNTQSKSDNERDKRLGNSKTKSQQHPFRCSNRQPTCIGFSEIDKYATQIYKKHFPEHKEYGDVSKIKWNDVPDFDLLVGGFPCQAFSIAGKREGFNDTRGTLFFEIVRATQEKQPRLLFLENVKGLLSHDKGRTFRAILVTLDELGYDLQWQVLNSKNFGVPQNRERVFIVGHLRGTSRPQVFPVGETNGQSLDYVGAIMSEKNKKWLDDNKQFSRNFPQGQRVYSVEGVASSICGEAGGLGGKTGLYGIAPCVRAEHHNTADVHFVKDILERKSDKLGRMMPIHRARHSIRRLTPTECERLQSFPDGWTEGLSDTQRYKCLGNAVTVNVIEAIIKKLCNE